MNIVLKIKEKLNSFHIIGKFYEIIRVRYKNFEL